MIEDDFPLGRPRWEIAGAQFARDVEPFEHMKLRMLNGSHSTLAYTASMAGHETVAEASNDPRFIALLRAFWAEVIPSLSQPDGQDPAAYADALLARFQNTAIRHMLQQIAMDGSQKLPQRLLGTIPRQSQGQPPDRGASDGVAAWMCHVGRIGAGARLAVNDPMAARFAEIVAASNGNPTTISGHLLAIVSIFGRDLPLESTFRGEIAGRLMKVAERGAAVLILRLSRPDPVRERIVRIAQQQGFARDVGRPVIEGRISPPPRSA